MEIKESQNYYQVLEIPEHASTDDIYQGYVRAKGAYSQESSAVYSLINQEECKKMLDNIEEAYSILSEPQKRMQYDNARGLNQKNITQNIQEEKKETKNLDKIVAKNRYALNYEIDDEFEKVLESTTEFTGSLLKKIREYKNIDISRMADMTKVSKTYIVNIENEKIQHMPALVYVRGFVYQYAKCLRLKPDLVASSYILHLKRLMANDNS